MTIVAQDRGTDPVTRIPAPRLRVVVVNCSPSRPSRTMGLVNVVLDTVKDMLPIEVSRVDVYRLGARFTGAIEREDVTPEVEDAIRLAENADLLIAAAPVFPGFAPRHAQALLRPRRAVRARQQARPARRDGRRRPPRARPRARYAAIVRLLPGVDDPGSVLRVRRGLQRHDAAQPRVHGRIACSCHSNRQAAT